MTSTQGAEKQAEGADAVQKTTAVKCDASTTNSKPASTTDSKPTSALKHDGNRWLSVRFASLTALALAFALVLAFGVGVGIMATLRVLTTIDHPVLYSQLQRLASVSDYTIEANEPRSSDAEKPLSAVYDLEERSWEGEGGDEDGDFDLSQEALDDGGNEGGDFGPPQEALDEGANEDGVSDLAQGALDDGGNEDDVFDLAQEVLDEGGVDLSAQRDTFTSANQSASRLFSEKNKTDMVDSTPELVAANTSLIPIERAELESGAAFNERGKEVTVVGVSSSVTENDEGQKKEVDQEENEEKEDPDSEKSTEESREDADDNAQDDDDDDEADYVDENEDEFEEETEEVDEREDSE